MPFLATLAEIRDGFIIVYGTLGIIFFIVATIITVVVGLSVKGLVSKANDLLDETIRPTVSSLKDTIDSVRGTTEFMGRTAVTPIVKTYGTVAGIRKGLGVLSGLSGRRRR